MSVDIDPAITANALKILDKRYHWTKADGSLEVPKDMFWRVATKVASAEAIFGHADLIEIFEQQFMEMMCSLRFMPNTPTLINAGRERGQLAACYVLPIGDSMEEIMDCIKAQAMVQKSGGGTGFNYGLIRESEAIIKSTGKRAVGPIPVIKLKNYMMTEFIIQGGARNGANMAALPIDHPNTPEFITFKNVDGSCKSFNISHTVPDVFMNAVLNQDNWDFISRVDGHVTSMVRADKLFDDICQNAWLTGDPGMLFIDTANRTNPTPHIGRLEATNPCGEQWLLPNEACTLGHLDLSKYYIAKPPTNGTWESHFNWDQFKKDIHVAVRFLDNVIEVNHYALPAIEQMHKRTNRKIGLGVMGEAGLFIKLGVAYGSQESLDIADKIAFVFRSIADRASCNLGVERGSFGSFEGSAVQAEGWEAMRNACRTNVAPTGSTAIIVGADTGIEPISFLILKREQAGMVMYETHPLFQQYLDTLPNIKVDAIHEYYFKHNTIQGCSEIDLAYQAIFVQANDVTVEQHIAMQAVWQKHVDNAISKTINLPNLATVEDVKKAFMLAWKSGCKGITIYRDGCRANQTLSSGQASIIDTVKAVIDSASSTIESIRYGNNHIDIAMRDIKNACPECTKEMDSAGGCDTCTHCGFAVCHI